MNGIIYNEFEQNLIKNENISFIKMLIERDIKSYKYSIKEDDIIQYVNRESNKHLYNEIKKYNISNEELESIKKSIIRNSNYNLDIEYLPTEDWEFENITNNELVLTIPSYDMLSSGLSLFILVFPFAALFLSYFLIMVFR